MPEADLVKTGIKGLDEILFGGIPRGNIILVAGTAGTGKTTLGSSSSIAVPASSTSRE